MSKEEQNIKSFDEELVTSLKSGDDRLLKKFYLDTRPEFIEWARKKFSLGEVQAKDVYQDAVIIIYENIQLGKLDELKKGLKSFLYIVGRNIILNQDKKKNVIKNHEGKVSEHYQHIAESREKEAPPAIKNLISNMSEPCKSILIHYYYDNLPLKEIAHIMNYKNMTVAKNQKQRCFKRLKQEIEKIKNQLYS